MMTIHFIIRLRDGGWRYLHGIVDTSWLGECVYRGGGSNAVCGQPCQGSGTDRKEIEKLKGFLKVIGDTVKRFNLTKKFLVFFRRTAEEAFKNLVKTHEKYGWVTPSLSDG